MLQRRCRCGAARSTPFFGSSWGDRLLWDWPGPSRSSGAKGTFCSIAGLIPSTGTQDRSSTHCLGSRHRRNRLRAITRTSLQAEAQRTLALRWDPCPEFYLLLVFPTFVLASRRLSREHFPLMTDVLLRPSSLGGGLSLHLRKGTGTSSAGVMFVFLENIPAPKIDSECCYTAFR